MCACVCVCVDVGRLDRKRERESAREVGRCLGKLQATVYCSTHTHTHTHILLHAHTCKENRPQKNHTRKKIIHTTKANPPTKIRHPRLSLSHAHTYPHTHTCCPRRDGRKNENFPLYCLFAGRQLCSQPNQPPSPSPSCRCVLYISYICNQIDPKPHTFLQVRAQTESMRAPCKCKQRVQQPDLFLILPSDFFSHTHNSTLVFLVGLPFCALPVPKRVAVAEGSLKIKATANDKTEFKIKIEPGCMQV